MNKINVCDNDDISDENDKGQNMEHSTNTEVLFFTANFRSPFFKFILPSTSL